MEWLLWTVIAIISFFLFAFLFYQWQRRRFESLFGFRPGFRIKRGQAQTVNSVIEEKKRELLSRPWKRTKGDPEKLFKDYSETLALFEKYRRLVFLARFFGFLIEHDRINYFWRRLERFEEQVSTASAAKREAWKLIHDTGMDL